MKALRYILNKGYSSLPTCSETEHPNLVTIYLDAQHDALHNRVYLLGARVVAHEGGRPRRYRNIVRMADGPPDTARREEALVADFVRAVLQAVESLAAPDAHGEPRAPVHVVCWGVFVWQLLLDALSRCFAAVAGEAPALYDLLTQIAPEDRPFVTLLEREFSLANCPSVCQTLQSAASYCRFRWDRGERYQHIFRERLFDAGGKKENEEFYTRRARFDSQIPLDYAYVAWRQVPPAQIGATDRFRPYRQATPQRLRGLMRRYVEALAHIAWFLGPQSPQRRRRKLQPEGAPPPVRAQKHSLLLSNLSRYSDKADRLSGALREFIAIERYTRLHDWKTARHATPEQRLLAGQTLLATYHDADQSAAVAGQNAANTTAYRDGERWTQDGLCIRLDLSVGGGDCSLEEALAMTDLSAGDRLVIMPRLTCDERRPVAQRSWHAPSPRQMLYGARAELLALDVQRDAAGAAVTATATVRMCDSYGDDGRFLFPAAGAAPFENGGLYTLDADPNDAYAKHQSKVVEEIGAIEEGRQEGRHVFYERLASLSSGQAVEDAEWPEAAATAQARFVEGILTACQAGLLTDDLDERDQDYIGSHGAAPLVQVQGPPGTGKTAKSALKAMAHIQGAMAAGTELRVYLSANTHSATDVMLKAMVEVQEKLRGVRSADPALFDRYFDARLLDVPLFRAAPAGACPAGATELPKAHNKGTRERASNVDLIRQHLWCVVAATPGGVYGLFREKWTRKTFHRKHHCGLLILDETSRMTVPEAMLATLPLHPGGQVVIVGDHRQMPPITQHDWAREPRRTFREYRTFLSLYESLLPLDLPRVHFERTYRCHKDIAAFLQDAFYRHDGIGYHSRQTAVLPAHAHADPFTAAVLAPGCPLTMVVHGEQASETHNPYEVSLLTPVIEALTDPGFYGLDAQRGLGVVAVHRDQRAAFQRAHPHLTGAVNTVEKYQGDERDVILISATESDPAYLREAGEFLLDPRRLCVALSRARRKAILVVSQSVFSMVTADEVLWQSLLVWQSLLHGTCTRSLWRGERGGHPVEVWGSLPDSTDALG